VSYIIQALRSPARSSNRRQNAPRITVGAALLVAIVSCYASVAYSREKGIAPVAASGTSDPLFHESYMDIDEWRDKPVRHRYVHGGFKGTEARFSFYLPPNEQYQGRFFQYIDPVPSSENLAQQIDNQKDTIAFSIASGGYFVESNEGGLAAIAGDQTIPGYRVSAASAEYSRTVAAQMYGPHRAYGYAWGGSGGGFKTISGFENTHTWDGAVPFVIGSPMALPNVFTVRLLALRVLKDKFASIVDAAEPGGSGDMYRGLNQEQKDVLREVTRMGFPPQAWFNYKTIGPGAFPVLFPLLRALDHSYFEDFWTVPGYLGANPPESLVRARIQHKTAVTRVVSAGEARANAPAGGVNTAWLQLKAEARSVLNWTACQVEACRERFSSLRAGTALARTFRSAKLRDAGSSLKSIRSGKMIRTL